MNLKKEKQKLKWFYKFTMNYFLMHIKMKLKNFDR